VYPGCVESISIEIGLSGLAVNTILQANHIPGLPASLLALEVNQQQPERTDDKSFLKNEFPHLKTQPHNRNRCIVFIEHIR